MTPSTVSVQQAAALLGISKSTCDRWLNHGTFPTPFTKVEKTWIIPVRPIYELLGYPTEKVDEFVHSTSAAA